MKLTPETQSLMEQRFSHDCLIALATLDNGAPAVRTLDAYYEDGAFYAVTDERSGKVQQIKKNPTVAICGDWFTAHGTAESLGHFLLPDNITIADKLRTVFAAWLFDGDIDINNVHTVILRIKLTDGVLFNHGTRHDIDFT